MSPSMVTLATLRFVSKINASLGSGTLGKWSRHLACGKGIGFSRQQRCSFVETAIALRDQRCGYGSCVARVVACADTAHPRLQSDGP